MSTNFDESLQEVQRRNVLPPWLWFWMISYFVGLPAVISIFHLNIYISPLGNNSIDTAIFNVFQLMEAVVDVLLELSLLLGILSLLFPWLRTTLLERRYRLIVPSALPPTTLPTTWQSLAEVSTFIKKYAPEIIIKYSTRYMPGHAFVYPIGYRRTGLALSGQLLDLWRKDQQAAKAILLHEIAHYRQGDAYIIGAGSLFEIVIRRWLLLLTIFILIPIILTLLIYLIENIAFLNFLNNLMSFIPLKGISPQAQQFFKPSRIPSILIIIFTELCWAIGRVLLPLVGIWCAEMNADRFVLDTMQSTGAWIEAVEHHKAPSSFWRWLFYGLSHPPRKIRRLLVAWSNSPIGLVLLLLLFPLSWIIRNLFLLGSIFGQELSLLFSKGTSISDVWTTLGAGAIAALAGPIVSWLIIAVILLLWPALARYWERFFGRVSGQFVRTGSRVYALAAGFLVCLSIISVVMSALPAPITASTNTPEPTSPATISSRPSGHFLVGDHVKIGNLWIVTVSKVQAKSSTGYIKAKQGNVFVSIDVSLKNISSEAHTIISSPQFTLEDQQGVSYPLTFISPTPPPEVSTPAKDGNLPAGATAQGQLNYETPAAIHQFTLSFKADWKNYDPATSKLTIWDIDTLPRTGQGGTWQFNPA